MYDLMIKDRFCAAHRLGLYDGKCENIHGHNYVVEIIVSCKELNGIGLGIDFYDLRNSLRSILQLLDHTFLNETDYFNGINPSAENIASLIFRLVKEDLIKNDFSNISLKRVNVWESDSCMASYYL